MNGVLLIGDDNEQAFISIVLGGALLAFTVLAIAQARLESFELLLTSESLSYDETTPLSRGSGVTIERRAVGDIVRDRRGIVLRLSRPVLWEKQMRDEIAFGAFLTATELDELENALSKWVSA